MNIAMVFTAIANVIITSPITTTLTLPLTFTLALTVTLTLARTSIGTRITDLTLSVTLPGAACSAMIVPDIIITAIAACVFLVFFYS